MDDIIFSATNEYLCKEFSNLMQREFEMSNDGKMNFFFGLQIQQIQERVFINRTKYTKKTTQKVWNGNSREVGTPMCTSTQLNKDKKCTNVNENSYRNIIGSLLYLITSRLDIMFVVCLCATFQSCPRDSHLIIVKHIFRYLKGTMIYDLWHPKSKSFVLIGFLDADFARYRVDRKNTSGTCHFLRDCCKAQR